MVSEAVAVTERVAQALEALRIPYLIGGSMASTAYGRIRATMDVDMVADLSVDQVDALVADLSDEFYADADMIRQAIIHSSSFNLIHLSTMFKVDIFVAKDRPFDRQQLARRLPQSLETSEYLVHIASPEDVILAKLEWYRMGGEVSERPCQEVVAGGKHRACYDSLHWHRLNLCRFYRRLAWTRSRDVDHRLHTDPVAIGSISGYRRKSAAQN